MYEGTINSDLGLCVGVSVLFIPTYLTESWLLQRQFCDLCIPCKVLKYDFSVKKIVLIRALLCFLFVCLFKNHEINVQGNCVIFKQNGTIIVNKVG